MKHLIPVIAALALGGTAHADVVHLKDGRKIEGAVHLDGETYVVRLKYGSARVHVLDVLKVEETVDAGDELAKLTKRLGKGSADDRYRLGIYARANGFVDEAKRAFLSVLRIDLDHVGARGALGYVQHEGRWVTVADRNRALGLVEHRGDWITPEEKAKRLAAERKAAEEKAAARASKKKARESRRLAKERDRNAKREAKLKRRTEAAEARARAAEALAERERQRADDYRRYPQGYGFGYGYGLYYGGYYPIWINGRPIYRPLPIYRPPGFRPPYRLPGVPRGGGISGSYRGSNWGVRGRAGGATYRTRSGYYQRFGVSHSGYYNGGNSSLRWRFGR